MTDVSEISGFTPGPWYLERRGAGSIVCAARARLLEMSPGLTALDVVARTDWGRGEEDESNARLVVIAPDMHAEIARLRREKEALVESLERVLQHDPKSPGLSFGGDWPLLVESIIASVRAAICAATNTEEKPRGQVVRKEIMATDAANPEWVELYMPGATGPITGRSGTLFEETEEILQGRAEKRSIIRVVDGKDSVVWQACYAVHRSPLETKDGQS